ncbi:uncharacterized protein LOC124943040 [Impatiens glandulifera]|uniref:uncharacterized protein LOC124943040 n=1 Tax=Impatiens glandulifera TaxID=253017 RepID=UPI001FB18EE6|nr:uncharacterized protein LOC124943040 [Impatiens glandulifera]
MSTTPVRDIIFRCLFDIQSNNSHKLQQNALQTLASITKVSPHNRNMLAQTDGAVALIFKLALTEATETLALSILFNLSLNPNLKSTLASDVNTIANLNSIVISPSSPDAGKIAASLMCSLAMLDKNKAMFGTAGTVQMLVEVISGPRCPATHHLVSTLAELVQFHGNNTLAVRSGAVPTLLGVVESPDHEDIAGISIGILVSLSRFQEGIDALRKTDRIVGTMIEVLKGKCMMSKEAATELLLRLFEDGVERLWVTPDLMSVLADVSTRGMGRARQNAGLLMRRLTSY